MNAPEVKNRKNAKSTHFHTFYPKIDFWAQNSLFKHFGHFWALLHFFAQNITKNGFTRAYEGSVFAKKLILAQSCQNGIKGGNGAIFDFSPPKSLFCSFPDFSPLRRPLDEKSEKPCRLLRLLGVKIAKISFGTLLCRISHFLRFGAQKHKTHHFEPKMSLTEILGGTAPGQREVNARSAGGQRHYFRIWSPWADNQEDWLSDWSIYSSPDAHGPKARRID